MVREWLIDGKTGKCIDFIEEGCLRSNRDQQFNRQGFANEKIYTCYPAKAVRQEYYWLIGFANQLSDKLTDTFTASLVKKDVSSSWRGNISQLATSILNVVCSYTHGKPFGLFLYPSQRPLLVYSSHRLDKEVYNLISIFSILPLFTCTFQHAPATNSFSEDGACDGCTVFI